MFPTVAYDRCKVRFKFVTKLRVVFFIIIIIIIARESMILSDDRKSLDYSLCMYAERMFHAITLIRRSDQSRSDGDNFEFKALAFRARCGNVLLNMNGPNFKLRLCPDSEGGSKVTLSRFCPIPYTLHSNPLL